MKRKSKVLLVRSAIGAVMLLGLSLPAAAASPDAETAKRCLRAAYLMFPYKRPGAVPMSGDRLRFFRECTAKSGEAPKQPASRQTHDSLRGKAVSGADSSIASLSPSAAAAFRCEAFDSDAS